MSPFPDHVNPCAAISTSLSHSSDLNNIFCRAFDLNVQRRAIIVSFVKFCILKKASNIFTRMLEFIFTSGVIDLKGD